MPQPEELRSLPSPVPTQTISGLDGATATAPMDWQGMSSKIGAKVMPLLAVYQTPLVAKPT